MLPSALPFIRYLPYLASHSKPSPQSRYLVIPPPKKNPPYTQKKTPIHPKKTPPTKKQTKPNLTIPS